jgi:hypothetical protein
MKRRRGERCRFCFTPIVVMRRLDPRIYRSS